MRHTIIATLARHDWNMQATVYRDGDKWFAVISGIEGGAEKPPREFASQLEAVEFAKTVLGL